MALGLTRRLWHSSIFLFDAISYLLDFLFKKEKGRAHLRPALKEDYALMKASYHSDDSSTILYASSYAPQQVFFEKEKFSLAR